MNIQALKKYLSISSDGTEVLITVASGPVIIESGKVLLDKHGDDQFWKFPGGTVMDNLSLQASAASQVKSEMGIDIEIISEPFIMVVERDKSDVKEYVILVHYLAKRLGEIHPGADIREWAWHGINNLPEDCAPNIKLVVDHWR